jgi:hypothetical protein
MCITLPQPSNNSKELALACNCGSGEKKKKQQRTTYSEPLILCLSFPEKPIGSLKTLENAEPKAI